VSDSQQANPDRPVPGTYSLASRRVFLRTAAGGAAAAATWPLLGANSADAQTRAATQSRHGRTAGRGPAASTVSFDAGWLFGSFVTGSDQPDFDDSALETVTLPHTVAPLSWQNWNPSTWEQAWIYRKHFDAPADVEGLRLFLDFEAAITQSTITLNGTVVTQYTGGYLPFSAEITDQLQPADNVLAVTLNSEFNIDVPPDRPAPYVSSSVDFWQPGGIYRDVQLRAVPRVFIADVFAQPVNVLDPANRQVQVQVTVDAALVPHDLVTITVELRDPDGAKNPVATITAPVAVTGTGQTTATVTLHDLPAIGLWDQDNPKLYNVITTLSIGTEPLHDYQVRIGFREASFTLNGFFLNGNRVKLFGLDRHQFFPFAGGAMPDRVQARDAWILRKELNCNVVRCSHYPQSEAFYDAADELGLMVWEEIPGWGYFGDAAWQEAAHDDLRQMIVRDRNHPSIGLTPGATITHDGLTFTWPDVEPGQPGNVVAEGQTILLSGSGTTLGVIGAGSPSSESGSGTIYYTDGTTSSFTITLDNYFDSSTGNDVIATLPYINDTNPATAGDNGQPGQRDQTVYVFHTSAPITEGKTVQGIELPTGGTIPASGRISGMHIFALAIGPLSATGAPLTGPAS
jgi:beta-galactosidase